MAVSLAQTAAGAVALWLATTVPVRATDSIHYVLTAESRITYTCHTCEPPVVQVETLTGSFDVTAMPVPSAYAVEAVTGVDWRSQSFTIRGAGFQQRLGTNRMAMVIDAHVNDTAALLTTGRRQRSSPDEIRLILVTPDRRDASHTLTIVAVPGTQTAAADADADGIPDIDDNCVGLANREQQDTDRDGVGDACDVCADTSLTSPVLADGCAVYQRCACDGPDDHNEWDSQRAYLQCVAGVLRELKRKGRISRRDSLQMMQDAVRSGCGQRIVAMR